MTASKEQRNRPPNAGNGRPKGAKNKLNRELREMILTALEEAGGVDYLVKQTKENPRVFMALLGRLVPREVTGPDGADLIPPVPTRIIIHPVRPLHELEG